MKNNTVVFYNQAKQVWEEIARDGQQTSLDFQLEVHKKLLNIFQPGNYYYFIFNVSNAEFEFISDQIKPILGYDSAELSASEFLSNIHREDQPYFIHFEQKLATFFRNLPIDKILKYKVQYDFRIRNGEGNYIRILHQLAIIEHDDHKNLLRSLGVHTDISHIKQEGLPKLSFLGLDGEPSFYDVPVDQEEFRPSKELFTRREKEVLRLIVQGLTSFEIAEQLHISPHTVHSHRKNLLQKSTCTTPNELVAKAIREGWV